MRWIFKKDLGNGKTDFYYIERTVVGNTTETKVLNANWDLNDSSLVKVFLALKDDGYVDLNLHDYTEEQIQEMISAAIDSRTDEKDERYCWSISP